MSKKRCKNCPGYVVIDGIFLERLNEQQMAEIERLPLTGREKIKKLRAVRESVRVEFDLAYDQHMYNFAKAVFAAASTAEDGILREYRRLAEEAGNGAE